MPGTAKSRHMSTIIRRVKRFTNKNDPKSVRLGDKLSKHFHGSNFRALAKPLNMFPAFAADGLKLVPDDLEEAQLVRDLNTAVVGWYERNGWTINR